MAGSGVGRYKTRLAETPDDQIAAQRLRYKCFRGTGDASGIDADSFDDRCSHMLVEEVASGRLVCCFRFQHFENGRAIGRSYAAQFYGLDRLEVFEGPMLEMGRFCIDPEVRNADVLRVAWSAMTRYVLDEKVELMFGCSSFKGTEAEKYMDAFALLKDKYLGPKHLLPRVKAPRVFRFARRLRLRKPDVKLATLGMPPLLRSYLVMGGWVSDHAVVDKDLDTLHVFTGLEIRAIPRARLRSMASI